MCYKAVAPMGHIMYSINFYIEHTSSYSGHFPSFVGAGPPQTDHTAAGLRRIRFHLTATKSCHCYSFAGRYPLPSLMQNLPAQPPKLKSLLTPIFQSPWQSILHPVLRFQAVVKQYNVAIGGVFQHIVKAFFGF